MARLNIENLCFSVGKHDILKRVNLTVEEGACTALLGPSGCGKTTTLRCIAGFVRPTHGEITFNGNSVLGLPAHKRNVGLVFQDYALFPHMTVAENVAYGLRRRGVVEADRKARILKALALVQLETYAERLPKELSGGQQQRVALARALVIEPNVLLLDEPLGALDRQLRDQMQVELKRIQREAGITTIIVTHDQEEALSLSDHVAVMLDGQIAEVGQPTELYRTPKSREVMSFLGASNLFEGRVTNAAAGTSELALTDGFSLAVAGHFGTGEDVRIGVRPERITVTHDRPDTGVNILSGKVEEAVYKGTHAELYVGLDRGPQMLVRWRETAGASVDDIRIGQPVYLSIEPDNILVFE